MLSEGHLERKSRGRPMATWTVNMFERTGLIYSEAVRNSERRTEWRVIASKPISQRMKHNDDDGDEHFRKVIVFSYVWLSTLTATYSLAVCRQPIL